VDPVRDGTNWFAYVNNDPVNYLDPWGLDAVNNTGHVIMVKPEKGKPEPLNPYSPYTENTDGVITPDGQIYKGAPWVTVTVTEKDGTYSFGVSKGGQFVNALGNGLKSIKNFFTSITNAFRSPGTEKALEDKYGIYNSQDGYSRQQGWLEDAKERYGELETWDRLNSQSSGSKCGK
jgi:hypothetical protein